MEQRNLSPDEQDALRAHRQIADRLKREIAEGQQALKEKKARLKLYEKHIRDLTGEKPSRKQKTAKLQTADGKEAAA